MHSSWFKHFILPGICLAGIIFLIGCNGSNDPVQPPTDNLEDSGDDPAGSLPACTEGPFLTESPVAFADIQSIVGLGNINPPGHISPTDHIYFYLKTAPDDYSAALRTDLFSPGELQVTLAIAVQHVESGLTDFTLNLQPCEDITLMFGHVTSLDSTLFGDTTNFSDWTMEDEYDSGTETIRSWSKEMNLSVAAGQLLGTVGGNPGQFALDVGLFDLSLPPATMASGRWDNEWYLYARCPLSYFVDGPVRDELFRKVTGSEISGDTDEWCGVLHDDVPGALQGCWFLQGTTGTFPENNNISFTTYNLDPRWALIGVGDAIATLPPDAYTFEYETSGSLNLHFDGITADGRIHGFQPVGAGDQPLILVKMTAPDTLWVEGAEADTPPDDWAFTAARTVFVR